MRIVTYAGPLCVDPIVNLEWENGQARELDDGDAERLLKIAGFTATDTRPRRPGRFVPESDPLTPSAGRPSPEDTPNHEGMPEREEG